MNFLDKVNAAIKQNQSLLCVGLDPNPEMLPERYYQTGKRTVEALKEWLHFVIAETADLVCAYKPTLGFYQSFGAEGIDLLQQILKAIPASIPVILDAKHSDLNTSTVFAETVFSQWQVDAVTLCSYAGQDQVAPFLLYPDKAVFVLCHTSNPSAIALQSYPSEESPFYLQMAKVARTWGTPDQLGLELGAAMPDALARIRAAAPERVLLIRSVWAQSTDLAQTLAAGLNTSGDGLLVPIPQDWLGSEQLAEKTRVLRDEMNGARTAIVEGNSNCEVWFPDICLLNQHRHQDLILQLYDLGCLSFGEFVQASGETFPYYIDLRTIISNPQIFHKILNAYADILKNLSFDRIAGIPYGSLPTAAGLALHLHCPMIFPRKEVKAHGTRRLIEGHFQPGETIVVVDDILISGNSAMEGAEKIKSTGLHVNDIVVFIDHEKGVKERLRSNGYQAHAVLTISEIATTLHAAGRINEAQLASLSIH